MGDVMFNKSNISTVPDKQTESRGERLWKRMLDYRQNAKLSLARAKLLTASYKETEGLPSPIRRAKAFEKIVTEIPIYIEDDDLLAGAFATRPMDFEWYPEFAVDQEMLSQNLDTLLAEGDSPEDTREIIRYFKDRCLQNSFLSNISNKERKRIAEVSEDGAWIYRVKNTLSIDRGYHSVDYNKAIQKGFLGVLDEVEKELLETRIKDDESYQKVNFLKGLAIVLNAGTQYAKRHAILARELADRAKGTRKAELEKMAKDAGFEFWYQLYNDRRNHKNYVGYPVVFAWVCTVPSPKQPMVADRNPYYWKVDTAGNQLPYIDRIEHMIVEGKDMLNLRAAAGEVDMQLRHITIINYPIFQDSKEKGDYRVLMWSQAMATDAALAINLTNKDPVLREILADKRARWALSLGINRDEIIQSAYLGMAEPSQVAPTPSSPYYWEEQAKNLIEYDPDRANKLLDEMGLTEKDGEGYRLRPDGKRLTIIFEYAPVFGSWGDIGELLTAHWKKLGIELVPKEIARQLMYERKAANEHDMGMWTGSGEFNPLIDPRWFIPFSGESIHAGQYAAWWNTGGKEGEEPTGDLRKVLEIYDQIKVTVDPEEQKKLFRQILELNKENLWVIGICTPPPQPVIVKNDFRNVPEHGASDWQLKTPGSTAPEQYFFRQD